MTNTLRARQLDETCNLCVCALSVKEIKKINLKMCNHKGSDHYKHVFHGDHPSCLNYEIPGDKSQDAATDSA